MKATPSSAAIEPAPRRQSSKGARRPAWPPQTRAAIPAQAAEATAPPADTTAGAPASRPAAQPRASRPADPSWAAPLRAALEEVHEAEQRHRHALDRLPLLRDAEDVARRAHAAAEAAADFGRGNAADTAHARQRVEGAEAERAKGERIAAGLAGIVEQRRAELLPLVEPAREALLLWLDQELSVLEKEYGAAIQSAANVIARAIAIGDAVGAMHAIEPMFRVRLPGSLLRADVVHQIGTLSGMIAPAKGLVSEQGAALRELLDAARGAAEPSTTCAEAV